MATMTREQFVAKAAREAERALGIPLGWWGDYRHVYGPNGERVFFSSGGWTCAVGEQRSRHDSRAFALGKALRLSRAAATEVTVAVTLEEKPVRRARRRRHSGSGQVRCDMCAPLRCSKATP